MRISLIVAMDRGGLIGADRGLPWRLSADLKRFRKLTTGTPIIMGRKTLEQIGGPLRDRFNIVLTRQPAPHPAGCTTATSLDDALRQARDALPRLGVQEIFVIGGADVYRQALPVVERIYLTVVEGRSAGSVYFPFAAIEDWRFAIRHDERQAADEKNAYPHRFLILDRAPEGIALGDLLI